MWDILTIEIGSYIVRTNGVVITLLERWLSTLRGNPFNYSIALFNRVIIEEYDDRYIEKYSKLYPSSEIINFIADDDVDSMEERTVWKLHPTRQSYALTNGLEPALWRRNGICGEMNFILNHSDRYTRNYCMI